MKQILLTCFLAIQLGMNCVGQDVSKTTDKLLGTTIIKYYNQKAQVLFQRVVGNGSDGVEIGLIAFITSVSSDDFLTGKAAIVFEDGSVFSLDEKVNFSYLYSGRHELSITHSLSKSEIARLTMLKIKGFRLSRYFTTLDKWEAEDVRKGLARVLADTAL